MTIWTIYRGNQALQVLDFDSHGFEGSLHKVFRNAKFFVLYGFVDENPAPASVWVNCSDFGYKEVIFQNVIVSLGVNVVCFGYPYNFYGVFWEGASEFVESTDVIT